METVRAFIAIKLAPQLLDSLTRLQNRMRDDVPDGLVRWVKPSGIHLTLQFLGDVAQAKLPSIAQALSGVCATSSPFTIYMAGMGCFPDPKRPRVIWVGIEDPSGTLATLQRSIVQANIPLGFEPERRRFSPHLTLGRVKGGPPAALQALGDYVTHTKNGNQGKGQPGEQRVDAINLIRSDLYPSGAVYTELITALLGTAAPGSHTS